MRNIKFRAWHKDIKEMFEVGQITLEKGIWDYQPKNRKHIGISIPYQPSFILMQYTGLHDKNGKEIYEGDIVLLDCYNYEEPAFDGEFKVIYDDINGMWLLIDLENKDRGFTFGEIRSYYKAEIEVIGNIYDNPELLGGE